MNVSRSCAFLIVLLMTMPAAVYAASNANTVAVELRPFHLEYRAYAQVEPRSILPIDAAATGEVSALVVAPGQHVEKGERLAKLTGPEYEAELTAALAHAHATQMVLRATRHNYPDFSTAQDVARAKADYQAAKAALTRIQTTGTVRAPAAGTVLTLNVSPGERVIPGATLLRLLPDNRLWLRAIVYDTGAGLLHTGMRGRFYPQDRTVAIPVRVRGIIPPQATDGGVTVACVATTSVAWRDGEAGTLIITASPVQFVPTVPNSALIMDQGKWWVLLWDKHGLHPQPVAIGPSAGEWTFIRRGVLAGERVVAVNAYLLFHMDISRNYSPPD